MLKSPVTLRERAARFRYLASGVPDARDAEQLAVFAEELEAQARRLEENIRATRTHGAISRQLLGELKQTSAQAKEALRRAKAPLGRKS
jgi:hypothetical protein